MISSNETLPLNDYYEIIDYMTISKSSKWWSSVILFKVNNKTRIGFYLWQRKNNQWKRKHKFTISSKEEYEDILSVMKEYSKSL